MKKFGIDIDRQTSRINELNSMVPDTLEDRLAIDAAINYYELDINMQRWLYYTEPKAVEEYIVDRLEQDRNDVFGGCGLTDEDIRKECTDRAERLMISKGRLECQRDYFKGIMKMYPDVENKFYKLMNW